MLCIHVKIDMIVEPLAFVKCHIDNSFYEYDLLSEHTDYNDYFFV